MAAAGMKRPAGSFSAEKGAAQGKRGGGGKRVRRGPLAGDVVCFTGVPSADKEALGARLVLHGAVVHDSMDESVTVLVAGHTNTEKVHVAMATGVVDSIVTVSWAVDAADEALVARPDPAGYPLRPLTGFTVILSGGLSAGTSHSPLSSGSGSSDDEIHQCVLAHGGEMGSQVISKTTQNAKYAVVVRRTPGVSTQDVLNRAIVRIAIKQCIPVVWEDWVGAVIDHGCITEKLLTAHSLIDSEPTEPTALDPEVEAKLKAAAKRPPAATWRDAPLHGVTVFIYKGDADASTTAWLDTCVARLGACHAHTVTALTTHIVIAAPNSRRSLQNQRVTQIICGALTPSAATVAFPESNIITGQWLLSCFLENEKVPTRGYLYSLTGAGGADGAEGGAGKADGGATAFQPNRGRSAIAAVGVQQNTSTAGGYTIDAQTNKVAFVAAPKGAGRQSPQPGPGALPQETAPAEGTSGGGGRASTSASTTSQTQPPQTPVDDIAKAQKKFGKSKMFHGKVFVMSAGFAKAPKTTATRIVLAHGGTVLREGKLRAEGGLGAHNVDYFVIPHFSSRDVKAAAAAADPPSGVQTVTEDWLAVCLNYLQVLRALETEANPKVLAARVKYYGTTFFPSAFRKADLPHAEARAWISQRLSDLESGAAQRLAVPDPSAHFIYTVGVLRRQHAALARPLSVGAAGGDAPAAPPKPSPFLQHDQLRGVKKNSVGVAVCFTGLTGIEREHLAKVVQLLGGAVTPEFDADATTHVVVPASQYTPAAVKTSKTLSKAVPAAEQTGKPSQIVFGVTPEWMRASAEAGYFVVETAFVLFPRRAKHIDELGAAPAVVGGGGGPPLESSQASSEPTPVVAARANIVKYDPTTPSPRGCLNFDSTVRRAVRPVDDDAVTTAAARVAPGAVAATSTPPQKRIYLSLGTKANVVLPCHPGGAEFLQESVAHLGGIVVDKCAEATHLVTSTLGTTEYACIALASGKWVVSPAWVSASAHDGAWQDEAEHELNQDLIIATIQEQRPNANLAMFEKTLQLARAVGYWRRNGGRAFVGWRVYLFADDVFATVLASGGAVVVSRDLPRDWEDLDTALVLVDKKKWNSLTPEWRAAITQVNSVRSRALEAAPPQDVAHCTGLFMWIHLISSHLQRADFDYRKMLCSYDATTTATEYPPIPC